MMIRAHTSSTRVLLFCRGGVFDVDYVGVHTKYKKYHLKHVAYVHSLDTCFFSSLALWESATGRGVRCHLLCRDDFVKKGGGG